MNKFDNTEQIKGSPKLGSNSEPVAWLTPGAKGVPLVSYAPLSSASYPVFASPPDHRKVTRAMVKRATVELWWHGVYEVPRGAVVAALRAALGEQQ